MQLKPFFDPDTKLFALDKLWHFGATFGAALLLSWIVGDGTAWAAVVGGAVGFELGQWDIARNVPAAKVEPSALYPKAEFLPGYGFGLLDLAVGALGAT